MTPDAPGDRQQSLGLGDAETGDSDDAETGDSDDAETGDSGDAYEGLSPAARLAAQAYGVVSPYELGVRLAADNLRLTGFAFRGRTFTQTQFTEAIREVHEAGLLYRPGVQTGLAADPAWAPRLTIAAFEDGNLTRIEDRFGPVLLRRSARVHDADEIMRLRCHAVAGRFDAIAYDLPDRELRSGPGSRGPARGGCCGSCHRSMWTRRWPTGSGW